MFQMPYFHSFHVILYFIQCIFEIYTFTQMCKFVAMFQIINNIFWLDKPTEISEVH